jgi:hypothetical protein
MRPSVHSTAVAIALGGFVAVSCGRAREPAARGSAGEAGVSAAGGVAGEEGGASGWSGSSGSSGSSDGGVGGYCTGAPEPPSCAAEAGDACPREGELCSVCTYGGCLGWCGGGYPYQSGYENFVCLRYSSHLLWRSCGQVNAKLSPGDPCASTRGDVCQLPQPDPRECAHPPGSAAGSWYNSESGSCEPLDFAGCQNPNAFPSREACEAACSTRDAGVVSPDAG